MTVQEIRDWINRIRNLPANREFDPRDRIQLEIALQLALLNEHNARWEARYMELTKAGVRSKESGVARKSRIARKPTTVKFKTKSGSTVSMKAIKTEIHNS